MINVDIPENEDYLRIQENLYWNSHLKNKKWYREIYGGKWRLIKLGKDTPYTWMFCIWTKMPDECWEGYKEVLEFEEYPYTGIDTKFKLRKEIFNHYLSFLKITLFNNLYL